jgi:hypothetical protein
MGVHKFSQNAATKIFSATRERSPGETLKVVMEQEFGSYIDEIMVHQTSSF